MYNKRNIVIRLERIQLILKLQRVVVFMTLFIINFLIPLSNLFVYVSKGVGVELIFNIKQMLQIFIPFTSCLCVVFSMKSLFEDKGSEVLLISTDRTKLIDVSLVFVLGIINITITTLPYCKIIDDFFCFFAKIIFVCIFYFGMSYFISMLSQSITPTLLSLIVYTLLNLLSPAKEVFYPLYYSPEVGTNMLMCEIPLFLTGFIFIVLGAAIINNKLKELRYRQTL